MATAGKKDYGRETDLSRSFIRLQSPDLKKYGGNVRVNKVVLTMPWAEEETPAYGTVYEYETEEMVYDETAKRLMPTGRMISSGVAINEPAVGTDESALRYSKDYIEDFRLRKDNLLTFEYPVNESYYPGASVGYSKVTVKSLATDYAIKDAQSLPTPPELPNDLPDGFATSGVTVHEFYTAKDFPIKTTETFNDHRNNRFMDLFIPLIGQITRNEYIGSQGYTIELNDMHGKPLRVTNYGMDDNDNVLSEPISWVRYDYQHDEEVYHNGPRQKIRKILNNKVDVISGDPAPNDPNAIIASNEEIGVDREFFTDIRESTIASYRSGKNANLDLILALFFPIPIISPWPDLNEDHTHVRTAVTNKIIRRSGVLSQVVANDGQSTIITENKAFDPFTGQPILTSVE